MTNFDISDTLAPTSDQLDAVDLLGGPRTFVIEKVSKGDAEQPVQVHLQGFPRPWRPGKSMRRVLASCWGTDAAPWAGRAVKLYCDESVRFGNEAVGGTRIAALSHIDKTKKIPLLISKGRSAVYTVTPLTDADRIEGLRAEWKAAEPDRRKQIEADVRELEGSAQPKPSRTPREPDPQVADDDVSANDPSLLDGE